ncbi:Bax inhibitor-1/YccA family membrane protein [Longimicrobium sp.]|uniref:Bax inhibitor-1/YccA family protein n=1 Tax=Longimicrobium sp. TaxID=2029185 RepID=UPI003B3B1161
MRTSNPSLNSKTFEQAAPGAGVMTIGGTVNKVGILLVLMLVPASYMFSKVLTNWDPNAAMGTAVMGAIGALIFALITVFKKTWAPVTAPIYAVLEGLFLGGISGVFEARFPGIALQAIALTIGTLFTLLLAYRSGLIRATENFKLGIVAATGGIFLFYMASIVLGFFGVQMPLIHSNGTFGILFTLFVVVIAALNLVLDFDFIEQGAEMGAPKYMEWYAAFGLMVTLVWLYLEILRLLAKLQSRD